MDMIYSSGVGRGQLFPPPEMAIKHFLTGKIKKMVQKCKFWRLLLPPPRSKSLNSTLKEGQRIPQKGNISIFNFAFWQITHKYKQHENADMKENKNKERNSVNSARTDMVKCASKHKRN